MGNVLKPLAKSVLIPLGLMAAASATNAAIHNNMFGSGFTTLIISNEEMEEIMKIVKSVGESGYKWNIKNEAEFLGMLLDTSGASLLRNLLTSKGTIGAGEGTIRAGKKFLMLPHPLTDFEIQNMKMNLNLMVFIQEIL